MPTFTVFQPPLRDDRSTDPDRFAFVRDGFHFWAFVAPPVWMIARGLWLVLLGFVVLTAILSGIFYVARFSQPVVFGIEILIGLLIGFEASTLRRWTFVRRGWRQAGFVVAHNYEEAEQKFFHDWVETPDRELARATPSAAPGYVLPQPSPDVIGSFPVSGALR